MNICEISRVIDEVRERNEPYKSLSTGEVTEISAKREIFAKFY